MAPSTCGRCGSTIFEIAQQSPLNADVLLTFVQCAQCGTVVGVFDDAASRLQRDGAALLKTLTESRGTARAGRPPAAAGGDRDADRGPDVPAAEDWPNGHG